MEPGARLGQDEGVAGEFAVAGVDGEVEALDEELLQHGRHTFGGPGLVAGNGGAQVVVGVERGSAAFDLIGRVGELDEVFQGDAGEGVLRAARGKHAEAAIRRFDGTDGGSFKGGAGVDGGLLSTGCRGGEEGEKSCVSQWEHLFGNGWWERFVSFSRGL